MQYGERAALRRCSAGFTLGELLVVVAIVGILSAIAYPSYANYVKRSNRARAQALMLNITNREEQFLLDAKAFTAGLDSTGLNLNVEGWTCSAATCSNPNYNVTVAVSAGPPPSYTITATALGTQVSDGNLTLNNLGNKTPSDKW